MWQLLETHKKLLNFYNNQKKIKVWKKYVLLLRQQRYTGDK